MPWLAGVARSELDFSLLVGLQKTYRDDGVWTHVKDALIESGQITAGS